MKNIALLFLICLWMCRVNGQSLIVAGPMCGYTEFRTARVWTGLSPAATSLQIAWWEAAEGRRNVKTKNFQGSLGHEFNPTTMTLTGLRPGTRYNYELIAKDSAGGEDRQSAQFTTQVLWQWRVPAPDFSFLAGSCSFINDPEFDRPGAPYGSDSSIFLTMAKQPVDFMLWLGDNWYTRDADYGSSWGLRYRAHHDRRLPVLQPLLKAFPHYAIWDDHDFGPNDGGSAYLLKEESREVFSDYWPNPSYGENGKGNYTQFNHNDVAFFLLDDRSWRSNEKLPDSIGGLPNPDKRMFGADQLRWLKESLLMQRAAPFKIIATGSQVLNPLSPYDCFRHYKEEFRELMEFIASNNISGVLFLTGDRHHSEIIRMDREGSYPLFDITSSPLTSHSYAPAKVEELMSVRVPGTLIVEQNFAIISVSGGKGKRVLRVRFLDLKGMEKGNWEVSEQVLSKRP